MKLFHIGRALENEIVVDDASISRKHAQLFIDDIGTTFIIDLNSTNGTFVNGVRIQGKVQLSESDILKLGSKIVSWQVLVSKVGVSEEVVPEVDLEEEEEVKKGLSKNTLIIGGLAAAVLILATVLLFTTNIFGGGSVSTADLAGRWTEKEDPKAWIEFKEDGTYEEGYDKEVIFTPATWEQEGKDALLIKHDGITVIYHFELKSSSLTISRTDQEDVYEKG